MGGSLDRIRYPSDMTGLTSFGWGSGGSIGSMELWKNAHGQEYKFMSDRYRASWLACDKECRDRGEIFDKSYELVLDRNGCMYLQSLALRPTVTLDGSCCDPRCPCNATAKVSCAHHSCPCRPQPPKYSETELPAYDTLYPQASVAS